MEQKVDLPELDKKIQKIKKEAEDLKQMAEGFPALNRNAARILASVKMLEINISDVLALVEGGCSQRGG